MTHDFQSDLLTALSAYTIGFLVHGRDEQGRPAALASGSGVLAYIHGVRGIITAAHVIRQLKKVETISLFTITGTRRKSRSLKFKSSEILDISVGGEDESPLGPDLGFLQVPLNVEEFLVAENNFYNVALRIEESATTTTPLSSDVIAGVVAEKSELKEYSAQRRVDTHTMDLAPGNVFNERPAPDGFDLFDFEIQHDDTVSRPKSYGGLSGAAIWRVGETTNINDRLIFGIAFYESDPDTAGRRTITCHGPKGIYDGLFEMVGLSKKFRRHS